MPNYRRADVEGATYFFTVVTHKRQRFLCDKFVRASLRNAIYETKRNYPFEIDAWVLMPDHLHCIWILPAGDGDCGIRWANIKRFVSKECRGLLYCDDLMTDSRRKRNESSLWQRRFWEHFIRDQNDLNRYRDYIHWNPVKHGYVKRVIDWEYSTFHRFVKSGLYDSEWGDNTDFNNSSTFGE